MIHATRFNLIFGSWLMIGIINSICAVDKSKTPKNDGTILPLAARATSYFAQDPRRLTKYVGINPEFARSLYHKCVEDGFKKHPKLSQPASISSRIAYKLGLRRTLHDSPAFFDAMKIQFDCLQKATELPIKPDDSTLLPLAALTMSHFAKDPRRLTEYAGINPEFAKSPYHKCVKDGFKKHPELSKPIPIISEFAYDTGFLPDLISSCGSSAAMKIQIDCLKKEFNNLKT